MTHGNEPIPTRDTAPQRRLHIMLEDMGFYVEDEVAVAQYYLDCYVRELHLGFEADGPTHAGLRVVRDRRRDDEIMSLYRIPVLRVPATELRNVYCPEAIARIEAFIEEWGESAEPRRAHTVGAM